MYNTIEPPKLSTFTKFVKKKMQKFYKLLKYVFITKYVKACKIKYVLFYCKSREMNLSFAILNLSCFSKNMYLHTNPSPSNNIVTVKIVELTQIITIILFIFVIIEYVL
jgi:hypothetical protein